MIDFLYVFAWVSIVLAPAVVISLQPIKSKDIPSDASPKDLMEPEASPQHKEEG
jgi:hypothetical protein